MTTSPTKPTILVFSDAYLPGYRSGGPIRTLANMVEQLGDEFIFRIITRDREPLDSVPYQDCPTMTWRKVGKAEVMYFSPQQWMPRVARRFLRETLYDVMYLNSLLSPRYTLLPLMLQHSHMIPRRPTILAPRGELSPGALGLKEAKKCTFLRCARIAGLYRHVRWQASAVKEEAEIRKWFGADVAVAVAPDLRGIGSMAAKDNTERLKRAGELRIVFLSRISRMKNLDGALCLLAGLRGRVGLHIYGPKEDTAYWHKCERIISRLPENVHVEYHGPVPNSDVLETLKPHHLFLLPTLGENFGHVIVEALSAGLPIIISDRTPWRGLEDKGVGYDLPLEYPERLQEVLQQWVDMDNDEYCQWSRRAYEYGKRVATASEVVEQNRQLFLRVLCGSGSRYSPACEATQDLIRSADVS